MNRQGCSLKQEGAQRPASNKEKSSAFVMDSPVIARGDQRLRNNCLIGYTAFLSIEYLISQGYLKFGSVCGNAGSRHYHFFFTPIDARYTKNPGMSGRIHGLRNEMIPARNATPKPKLVGSVMLPFA